MLTFKCNSFQTIQNFNSLCGQYGILFRARMLGAVAVLYLCDFGIVSIFINPLRGLNDMEQDGFLGLKHLTLNSDLDL